MATVGEKKRRKRERRDLDDQFGIAAVPRRETDGKTTRRPRTPDRLAERDPAKTALDARCRKAGWEMNRHNRAEAKSHTMEGDVGTALHIGVTDKVQRGKLFDVFAGLDAAETVYSKRILGRSRHAKTAKMEMEPGVTEVRPDDKPDPRSDEEKDREAVSNRQRWHGYLGHLPAWQRTVLFDAMLGRRAMVEGRKLTDAGYWLIEALKALRKAKEVGEQRRAGGS